jgi:hypothetical protein
LRCGSQRKGKPATDNGVAEEQLSHPLRRAAMDNGLGAEQLFQPKAKLIGKAKRNLLEHRQPCRVLPNPLSN